MGKGEKWGGGGFTHQNGEGCEMCYLQEVRACEDM